MKKLLFIINPHAGKTSIKNDILDIVSLFQSCGYETVLYPTSGPADAGKKVAADGAAYDLIVCAGGDGTLNNTISGYMRMGEKKTPIGYIPVGTTNDFAKGLRISTKPVEAARQIVNGSPIPVDVGTFGDRSFIYVAAFGIFTDIPYSTSQSLKKVMGHSAYVLEAVRHYSTYKPVRLVAELDGEKLKGEFICGMVTNSFSVGGFALRGNKDIVLDDGKFDCLFIKRPSSVAELEEIAVKMLMNDVADNELFFTAQASNIRIRFPEPVSWTLDGEFGGTVQEVEIKNKKKAVDMMIDCGPYTKGLSSTCTHPDSVVQ